MAINRERPYAKKNGPNFAGYKQGFDPKQKKFKDHAKELHYKVNERALAMVRELAEQGQGNRRGSGTKAHRAATEHLKELGFDPIDELLKQLQEIEGLLAKELALGEPRIMVVNNLINCKTRILENLLPYKYGKAPQMTIESEDIREPVRIILDVTSTSDQKT